MFKHKKVVVVMPAYNAAQTLRETYEEVMEQNVVDLVVVVDDCSRDNTAEIAASLDKVVLHVHEVNTGYGGNQKSCYRIALEYGADIVVMVHPDYQYTPKLLPAMVSVIGNGLYDCVVASRILGGRDRAIKNGMPLWKYAANRFLTLVENLLMGVKLSEYHTGYRAFSSELLERLPLDKNSDDFVFDNQMLAQIIWVGSQIGEMSCPTKYFKEASSINFRRSCIYGIGCLATALQFSLARIGLIKVGFLPKKYLDLMQRQP